MSIRYCATCVLPSSRPNLEIDAEGRCNCRFGQESARGGVNWAARRAEFDALVARIKGLGRDFDVVVPVSGGKDSTWQTMTALEAGLKPLAVTWRTPARTPLGQRNLDNLISLGVDHLDVSLNPEVERRFTWKTYERAGSPAIPMHMALHAIPLRVARMLDIPVVLWGENSAFEYGGSDPGLLGARLTRDWFKRYGVTNGTFAEDWAHADLTLRDLTLYRMPEDAEHTVEAVFLGHYLPWDPVKVYERAARHGFQAAERPLVGVFDFADVDDSFLMAVHHWLKWHKFGMTRSWDNLSLDIRAGRSTRAEAIEKLRALGDETPHAAIEAFAAYARKSVSEVHSVAETFRNHAIWRRDGNRWRIDDFLIDDWDWA